MIFHLNFVPWNEAPLPRRWHRCKMQTFGFEGGRLVKRCACGGIWIAGFGGWSERNSRRKRGE